MPGTLVLQKPSITMTPRSVLTPSFSNPRFSTLPTTPTAEITRSNSMVCGFLPSSMVATTLSLFLLEPGHLGAGQDLDAILLEPLARQAGDFGILDGEDLRQHLDHGDVRSHGVEERCEFDADRTR